VLSPHPAPSGNASATALSASTDDVSQRTRVRLLATFDAPTYQLNVAIVGSGRVFTVSESVAALSHE
jgi:hypothetical protein